MKSNNNKNWLNSQNSRNHSPSLHCCRCSLMARATEQQLLLYSWMPSSSPRPHHPLYSMTMRALLLVHWRGGGRRRQIRAVIVNHNFPDWNYVVHNLCGTLLNNNIGYWSVRLLPCPAQRTDQQLATIREMVYVLTVIEQKKAMRKNTTGRRRRAREISIARRRTQERVF